MTIADTYIRYLSTVKRYSERTCSIYEAALKEFCEFAQADSDSSICASISDSSVIRRYLVFLKEIKKVSARTANLHLSVLSGFSRYLVKAGLIVSDAVRLVPRPKQERRLPVFYREDSMREYFKRTEFYASPDVCSREEYPHILGRMVVSLLYCTGIRRSELIALDRSGFDESRKVLRVRGKGDKLREIPLTAALVSEIVAYMRKVDILGLSDGSLESPLAVSAAGGRLYPVLVDRIIKSELASVSSITSRKSPHALRHTIATQLLDNGSDINSIKEMLGHSSLAATQIYTHNSIEKLKKVYSQAHPRAKRK